MKYIKTVDGDTYQLSITFGPVLSADGITPYTSLQWSSSAPNGLSACNFSIIGVDGEIIDLSDTDYWLSDSYKLEHKENGYYTLSGIIDFDLSDVFTTLITSSQYLLLQSTTNDFLPYSMEFMVISPLAFNEMVYGSGSNFAEATYAAVSGSDNIQDKLASIQADASDNFDDLMGRANLNHQETMEGIVDIQTSNDELNTLISELKTIVEKIGSISADIVDGSTEIQGVTIKDIEVRDNKVYLAYKASDGKMKVYSMDFVQDRQIGRIL